MLKFGGSLLHLGFNQDSSRVACGSESGFSVFRCEPFRKQICHKFNNGGICIVEILFQCNILALVGGGTTPKFPPTKVMIWDEDQGRCIAELRFKNQIYSVRLRKDRVVVAQEQKVSVYNFSDLSLLQTIETIKNPKGLVSISSHPESTILACLGLQPGKIRVELYDRCQTKFISAHTSPLTALQLSIDGRLLASASETGTLIRIWNTENGNLLQELRRGSDAALIYSLSFSRKAEWLGVSSDKGTVHIFALNSDLQKCNDEKNQKSSQQNPTSVLNVVRSLMPLPNYFRSEWSFAQFRIPEGGVGLVGFATDQHTFYVITSQGSLYKVSFDPIKGGPCTQISITNFLNEK